MIKVLKHRGKHADSYWDASTPAKEKAAYRKLFQYLDEVEQYYYYKDVSPELAASFEADVKNSEAAIKNLPQPLVDAAKKELDSMKRALRAMKNEVEEKKVYDLAKQGDDKAILWLLRARKGGEYEFWELIDVEDPEAE